MTRHLILVSILIAAVSTGIAVPAVPVTHAQSTGMVCIADALSSSCPSGAPSFTGRLPEQRFSVNIQGSERFNDFDISVTTDPAVLEPFTIDLANSLFDDVGQITRLCINNHAFTGSCKTGVDDYGVVSLAVTALGYEIPTTGRLFTITYRVGLFGGEPFTTPITYQTGCASTSNNGFCVTITGGDGTIVSEDLQGATFSFRDFVFGMENKYLAIRKGETVTLNLFVATVGDYSGTVTFGVHLSPLTRRPPAFTITPSSITLSPGSSATAVLTIATTRSTTTEIYHFDVFAFDDEVIRTVCCTLLDVANR